MTMQPQNKSPFERSFEQSTWNYTQFKRRLLNLPQWSLKVRIFVSVLFFFFNLTTHKRKREREAMKQHKFNDTKDFIENETKFDCRSIFLWPNLLCGACVCVYVFFFIFCHGLPWSLYFFDAFLTLLLCFGGNTSVA